MKIEACHYIRVTREEPDEKMTFAQRSVGSGRVSCDTFWEEHIQDKGNNETTGPVAGKCLLCLKQ